MQEINHEVAPSWRVAHVREVYHSASNKLDVMAQGMQRRAMRGYGDCMASDVEVCELLDERRANEK